MTSADWYRNEVWNESVSDSFFKKLSRARSQRDQYLAIQALTLAAKDPHAALDLVNHYFETRKEAGYHDAQALLARVRSYTSLGDVEATIEAYKELLKIEEALPNITTGACYEYPYLVARLNLQTEYPLAMSVAKKAATNSVFPVDIYKACAAQAMILNFRGLFQEAQVQARRAVEAAQIKKSGFRYHQNIGLVGREHKNVYKALLQIAA